MTQFDWLLASPQETVYTVFDTETSGLDPKQHRVVEVGAIRFDSRGIIARFNVLINPKIQMLAEVTKINGITDAMLEGQPEPSQAIPDFLRFVGDSALIAHNAPFDIAFINEELSRLGLTSLTNRVLDTRIFAREMFPGLPKYALQDLARRFGITALEAHRAEDDARVCMELFLVCRAALLERNPAIATQPLTHGNALAPQATSPVSSATPSVLNNQIPEREEPFDGEDQEGLFDDDDDESDDIVD